jgi:hypothetical protein
MHEVFMNLSNKVLAATLNAEYGAMRVEPRASGCITHPSVRVSVTVESGEETLDIKGKRLSTRWQSIKQTSGNCAVTTKTWISDAVRGHAKPGSAISGGPELGVTVHSLQKVMGWTLPVFWVEMAR